MTTSKHEPTLNPGDTLESLRKNIDQIDDQLLILLNQRATIAQKIGSIKAQKSQKAYAPERERQVLQRMVSANPGPLANDGVRLIYKEIISASLALEGPIRVAFLGPEASFTHLAAKRNFGMSALLQPGRTIANVFEDVERGRSEYGVVPIENSIEGVVNHTLDMLMNSELVICAEVLIEVSHFLLSRAGSLAAVEKVYSHPQALAQCRGWLDKNLPGIPHLDVSSTSRAAEMARDDEKSAAIASELAASMYSLQVLASYLEDVKGNMTRFWVIGHDRPKATGKDRTSVMFALKDAPGILYQALAAFSRYGINMSRIESRPSRRRAWDYMFFIDLEGHTSDGNVKAGIDALQQACAFIKVLGSYPRGELEQQTNRSLDA